MFAFLVAFRVRAPNEFHEDFRHIFPALVPLCLGYVKVFERLGAFLWEALLVASGHVRHGNRDGPCDGPGVHSVLCALALTSAPAAAARRPWT